MIKTLFKVTLLAVAGYGVYRLATGKKIIPGLAGYAKQTALVDASHPRNKSCCSEVISFDVWEDDPAGRNRTIVPPDEFMYASTTHRRVNLPAI